MYLDYLKLSVEEQLTVDCFQLVRLFYEKEFSIDLPDLPYEKDWFKASPDLILNGYKGYGFTEAKSLSYGTVLVFAYNGVPRHLGIMVKPDYFIHSTPNGIVVQSLWAERWIDRLFIKLEHKDVPHDIFFP